MKTVVVTGASGQLGQHLVDRLLAHPDVARVLAVDVRPTAARHPKLEPCAFDVRDPGLGRVLEGADAVFHLAFLVFGSAPRELMRSVNVDGTRNVVERAAEAGVRQVVYASSIAAYGVTHGHPVPVVEDTPRRLVPDFEYSANKFEVEADLDALEAAHPALAIARMRVGILVGARMEHALGRAMQRRVLLVSSDAPWAVVWDEDVADAFVRAWERGARGAFNVAADDPEPPGALAAKAGLRVIPLPARVRDGIAAALDALTPIVRPPFDPAWMRHADVAVVPSSAKAHRELAWSPRHRTAADVVAHYVAVAPRPDPLLVAAAKALAARARRRWAR
ncbi:MAG: NAD-dependent epimerase/dehydratase family protein [Polyangiaceae bacterium]|nr:NAD-dependent epimerase/dehydratase family protein [Polyangiaceae bacterium]